MKGKKNMVVVPDDFSNVDQIGYSEYSAGLVEMIRSVDAKGSFTIGVFGQWGQGKTSMLRQIEYELNQLKIDSGSDILTAWFNPWQFTAEEHIIIPFFHTLASYLEEYKIQNEKRGKKIGKKVVNFLKVLSHVPVALAYGLQEGIKIPLTLTSILGGPGGISFNLKEVITEVSRKKEEIRQESGPEIQKLVAQYESMYYRMISQLQAASGDMQLKVVIFIDDLDRCLPEKAVELLEGLKVLLDIPGFVFVIGVAREVIQQGIRVRYRELYADNQKAPFLEQDYLDKIIQFPFTLPPPDTGRLKTMIAGYLENLPQAQPYLDTIQKALGINPRSLKRFINNLSYAFWVSNKKEDKGGGEFRTELLVKMTLIAFKFPGLYRVICRTPMHLLRVQDLVARLRGKDGNNAEAGEEGASRKVVQTASGFPELDDLNLFDYSNYESIVEILGKFPRKGISNDLGFANEEEVRKYISFLSATTTSGETAEVGTGSMAHTLESLMLHVKGGTLTMKDEESGAQFKTGIKPFYFGKFPVTQALYEKVMGKEKNHSRFPGEDRPVENVSWYDAVEYCNRLSAEMGLKPVYVIQGDRVTADFSAAGFRLPTEAEWEYACRGDTGGDSYGEIDKIAWSKNNSGGSTQGVGKKEPNPWGFYDMLGNVWEWCWDRYGRYPDVDQEKWQGVGEGIDRVFRGGSWNNSAGKCRANSRLSVQPTFHDHDLGFRLARSIKE